MSDSADSDNALNPSEDEDSEGTLRGDSVSENESDSGADNRGGGFFDLEAADSEDDESSEESKEESDASNAGYDVEPLFPRFMYLPPELRRRVWEYFCPEVLGMPRILEFVWDAKYKFEPISEGSSTANATEPARALAGVDRETREVVLRAFPEVLRLSDRRGKIRFSPKWDIVMIQHLRNFTGAEGWVLAAGFSDKTRHLAVDLRMLHDMSPRSFESLFTAFPNLEVVYSYGERSGFYADKIEWAESDKITRYTLRTVDDAAGLMQQEERLFVWPDLVNHRMFAEEHIHPQLIKPDEILFDADDLADVSANRPSVELWPMIEWTRGEPLSESDEEVDGESGDEDPFGASPGLQGYESDEIGVYADPLGHAGGETDSEEDLDRYEDDFVVDDGLVEYEEMGSDGLDGGSGGEDTDGEHGHPTLDHPGAYTVDPPADFSDLEPGSDEGTGEGESQGSENGDGSEDEGDRRRVPVRSRPRRAVISEDEDDEDEGDDEDEVRQAPARSRARRTVVSEDEDENENDDDVEQAPVRRRGRRPVVSEDEDEDE